MVRHLDKDHPHCHIVASRINNHAEVISDSNDFDRNKDVCLALTKEYGLHISEGKKKTKVENLKGDEKIRYDIFHIVDDAYNDKSIFSLGQFKARLKANGVDVEYKYRIGKSEIQGLWYVRKGKRFAASKIDRRFSYGNINKHIAQNKQKQSHPQSAYLYADGTIKPLSKIM
ncbi:MAG: relaxase/mobilization nuclease domain-containing protein [Bacteroides sp.]|nr:relaxase/mobilization nuclease domain-containing protein [Bacteroides sp.]